MRLLDGSGVSREAPAPFCERLWVKFLRPTLPAHRPAFGHNGLFQNVFLPNQAHDSIADFDAGQNLADKGFAELGFSAGQFFPHGFDEALDKRAADLKFRP